MKNFLLISILILSGGILKSFAEDAKTVAASTPVGTWMVAAEDAKVDIYNKGDELEGKISWLREPLDANGKEKVDSKNPEENLRMTPILNMVFLKGFKKDKDSNRWSGGTIYDAKSGKTYKAWMEPEGDKKMKLRGYVGLSLFGRTEEWTRQN